MLTDIQARKAKAAERPYKMADGRGLHLYVTPAGTKVWRLRYEFAGKEKLLSVGRYPDLSLTDARSAAEAAKVVLRSGRDPGIEKKRRRAAVAASDQNTFERVARDWHALQEPGWTEVHAADVLGSLERDVFPRLGNLPLSEIDPPMVLAVLRTIEKRPAIETARRVRQRISAVFVHAIASGIGNADPAAIVKGALAPIVNKGKQPAITDLEQARTMLREAEALPAHPVTKLALRFLALTVVRPGELRRTLWAEFESLESDAPLWRVPPERMKLKKGLKQDDAREHLVPLSRQAVEVLAVLRKITGRGPLVFPNTRHAHKPLSENAIGYLLNRAGYHQRHVPHGWRATFSTGMNERYRSDRAIIDLMLAHVSKDKVESAYNRAGHMQRRRELAQAWADLLMVGMPDAEGLLTGARR